jgi:hypothetical protein
MAERALNTSIDLAVTEPAASKMLEAVRADRILKYILTGETMRGFEDVCMETSAGNEVPRQTQSERLWKMKNQERPA